jgi:uncharacterized protein YycO
MIGSVVFFKNDSFISNIISNITKSEYTHVAIIVDYDKLTNIATIIESDRFVNTRMTTVYIDSNHIIYSVMNITDDVRNRIVEYAFNQLGKRYDYLQIFGLFISLVFNGDRYAFFNSSNKYICSELIDLAYYKSGVNRRNSLNIGNITPKELLEVYDFNKI